MRFALIAFVIVGIGLGAWLVLARPGKKEPEVKTQTLTVSKHSDSFNTSVENTLGSYYAMTESFVNWDSVKVSQQAAALRAELDRLTIDDLKKDSGIYETAVMFVDNAKNDVQTIASEPALRQKREALNSLSDNIYQFLNVVKFDRHKIYLQECPMAFDDTAPGLWLSAQDSIRNPYLGLHHPTYGRGMLHCGEVKTTINNTGVQ